mgnify:CR=1 FL=1
MARQRKKDLVTHTRLGESLLAADPPASAAVSLVLEAVSLRAAIVGAVVILDHHGGPPPPPLAAASLASLLAQPLSVLRLRGHQQRPEAAETRQHSARPHVGSTEEKLATFQNTNNSSASCCF